MVCREEPEIASDCKLLQFIIWLALINFVPSRGGGAGLHHMNASPSEKNMKTALVLLLAALLGLSEAEYRRTVSYEGEVVVRWYVSSVSLRPHADVTLILFDLHACSTGGNRERLRSLLEHNGTDVWGAGPDGVVIRMPKALYQKIHSRFSECTLQVEDLEIYVREWEKTVQRGADQATWFEEYVSGTENSGPFAYAEHVEYTTSRLLWGGGGGGGGYVFHHHPEDNVPHMIPKTLKYALH